MTALSINWASMAWRLLAVLITLAFFGGIALVAWLGDRRRWRAGSPYFRDQPAPPVRRRPPHL